MKAYKRLRYYPMLNYDFVSPPVVIKCDRMKLEGTSIIYHTASDKAKKQ